MTVRPRYEVTSVSRLRRYAYMYIYLNNIVDIQEMRVEIPQFKRCCCCVPLRCGILIFGYLNLGFYFLLLISMLLIDYKDGSESTGINFYKGVGFFSHFWLAMALFVLETIFNIILLVGTHMKKTSLMRAYYNYGITMTVAAFVVLLVDRLIDRHNYWHVHMVDLSMAFSGLVLQVYLLLLVRSELMKLRQDVRLTYVNHTAEVTMDPSQSGDRRNIS